MLSKSAVIGLIVAYITLLLLCIFATIACIRAYRIYLSSKRRYFDTPEIHDLTVELLEYIKEISYLQEEIVDLKKHGSTGVEGSSENKLFGVYVHMAVKRVHNILSVARRCERHIDSYILEMEEDCNIEDIDMNHIAQMKNDDSLSPGERSILQMIKENKAAIMEAKFLKMEAATSMLIFFYALFYPSNLQTSIEILRDRKMLDEYDREDLPIIKWKWKNDMLVCVSSLCSLLENPPATENEFSECIVRLFSVLCITEETFDLDDKQHDKSVEEFKMSIKHIFSLIYTENSKDTTRAYQLFEKEISKIDKTDNNAVSVLPTHIVEFSHSQIALGYLSTKMPNSTHYPLAKYPTRLSLAADSYMRVVEEYLYAMTSGNEIYYNKAKLSNLDMWRLEIEEFHTFLEQEMGCNLSVGASGIDIDESLYNQGEMDFLRKIPMAMCIAAGANMSAMLDSDKCQEAVQKGGIEHYNFIRKKFVTEGEDSVVSFQQAFHDVSVHYVVGKLANFGMKIKLSECEEQILDETVSVVKNNELFHVCRMHNAVLEKEVTGNPELNMQEKMLLITRRQDKKCKQVMQEIDVDENITLEDLPEKLKKYEKQYNSCIEEIPIIHVHHARQSPLKASSALKKKARNDQILKKVTEYYKIALENIVNIYSTDPEKFIKEYDDITQKIVKECTEDVPYSMQAFVIYYLPVIMHEWFIMKLGTRLVENSASSLLSDQEQGFCAYFVLEVLQISIALLHTVRAHNINKKQSKELVLQYTMERIRNICDNYVSQCKNEEVKKVCENIYTKLSTLLNLLIRVQYNNVMSQSEIVEIYDKYKSGTALYANHSGADVDPDLDSMQRMKLLFNLKPPLSSLIDCIVLDNVPNMQSYIPIDLCYEMESCTQCKTANEAKKMGNIDAYFHHLGLPFMYEYLPIISINEVMHTEYIKTSSISYSSWKDNFKDKYLLQEISKCVSASILVVDYSVTDDYLKEKDLEEKDLNILRMHSVSAILLLVQKCCIAYSNALCVQEFDKTALRQYIATSIKEYHSIFNEYVKVQYRRKNDISMTWDIDKIMQCLLVSDMIEIYQNKHKIANKGTAPNNPSLKEEKEDKTESAEIPGLKNPTLKEEDNGDISSELLFSEFPKTHTITIPTDTIPVRDKRTENPYTLKDEKGPRLLKGYNSSNTEKYNKFLKERMEFHAKSVNPPPIDGAGDDVGEHISHSKSSDYTDCRDDVGAENSEVSSHINIGDMKDINRNISPVHKEL